MSRHTRDERGIAALILSTVVAALFLPLAALGVDVARWYVEIARLQSAADAAALAGVTYMPDDLAAATTAAQAALARNGYPAGTATVAVERGPRPSELRVTLSMPVRNSFAAAFDEDWATMSATALADYTGPAPMGSPCNALGNEPNGTTALGPVNTQIVVPSGGSCPRTPQFWANVHGPNVHKTQGDRYASRFCAGGEDGCVGSVNSEFDPKGYFYVLRVGQAAVGTPVTVQVYDPAYVSTGVRCTAAPTGTVNLASWNPFTTTDALTRYARTASGGTPNAFCSGDDANAGYRVGVETPTVTSFALRAPTDTQRPANAPPITSCVKQFPGYAAGDVTANTLRSTNSSYLPGLAAVFHQWVPVCTFTPTRAGDHYLQVRTNVRLGGSPNGSGAWTGNQAVFSQVGDDPTVLGNGSNRFAVRLVSTQAAHLAVSGWERMSIYANADAATQTFNLVRVLPAAAGKILDFAFFDAGDAASNGSVQLLPPTESATPMGTCTGSGRVTGTLTSCRITGISAGNGWDGRVQHIRVRVPTTYTCNFASQGGCWFRVQVSFGSGTVTDVTTWSAVVEGDPVRLVQ